MSIYKVTRPSDSQREFAYGFAVKRGESIYLDNLKVAAAFNSAPVNWKAQEVDGLPLGARLVECMKDPLFQGIIGNKDLHFANKPKGKWLLEKPPGWQRVFVFGMDVRKPFEVEDYDLVEKFEALKFKVTVVGVEGGHLGAMAVSPVFGDVIEKEKDAAAEGLKAAMEGADKPKGAPLTTYSMPKRKPGRPPKVKETLSDGA